MAIFSLSVSDMKKGALRRAGELDTGTSQYETAALDYLNRGYLKILSGSNEFELDLSQPFSWAKEATKGSLILQPNYNAGTCTFTSNSTAIVFSTIPLDQDGNNIALLGYWIQATNQKDWYRIAAHSSGSTSATLDAKYTSTTVSGSSFNAVCVEYTLTQTNGILRLVSPFEIYAFQDMQGDLEGKIYFSDETTLLREYPMFLLQTGTPTRFTIINKTPAGVYTIRINKYVTSRMKVDYNWIKVPDALTDSTSVFTNIPIDHRECLEYLAAFWLCVDKNDSRAQEYYNLAKLGIKAMIVADNREKTQSAKNRGRLVPRGDIYARGKRYVAQEAT